MHLPIFHLAFPILDLEESKEFYVNVLGAKIGRAREHWIDIFLFGGQITLHEQPKQVPPEGQQGVRHFGAILSWDEWESLAKRLQQRGIAFLGKPTMSGIGTDAEQAKLHLADPSGNIVEVKAYRNPAFALENDDLPGRLTVAA